MREQGKEKNYLTLNGDIDLYFDNIGKYITKNYRVKADKNTSPTIITATINIPLKSDVYLQSNESLKPGNWSNGTTELEIQNLMEADINDSLVHFREFRFNYIVSLFVYLSTSSDMDSEIEKSLQQLKNTELSRICSSCQKQYPARKQKCDACGSQVIRNDSAYSRNRDPAKTMPKYFNIGECNNFNPSKITMSEPILVNPNSYSNVKMILDQLKEDIINNDRKWIFVGADGPPYCLSRRIIAESPECYDWVSVMSGKGRLNMNQVKTFFAILDNIMLEPLGMNVLKFDTAKAYKYFVQCKDNHKSWQALEVFLHGTIMELIRVYCIDCSNPTPLGFLQWQANITNPILKLVCQLTLNIGLGIYIQRVGDRNNDEKCSEAGRLRFGYVLCIQPSHIQRMSENFYNAYQCFVEYFRTNFGNNVPMLSYRKWFYQNNMVSGSFGGYGISNSECFSPSGRSTNPSPSDSNISLTLENIT